MFNSLNAENDGVLAPASPAIRPSEESDEVDQLDEAAYAAPALESLAPVAAPLGHLLQVLTDHTSQCDRCRATAHRDKSKDGPRTKVLARFNGSGFGIVKRTETDWAAVFEAVESATGFIVTHGVVVLDAAALAAKTSDCYKPGVHPTEWPDFVRAFLADRYGARFTALCDVVIRPGPRIPGERAINNPCQGKGVQLPAASVSGSQGAVGPRLAVPDLPDVITENGKAALGASPIPYIKFVRAPRAATNSQVKRHHSHALSPSAPSRSPSCQWQSPQPLARDSARVKSESSAGGPGSIELDAHADPASLSSPFTSPSADRQVLYAEMKALQEEHATLRARQAVIQAQLEVLEAREADLAAFLSERF
ncbi:hypothetical protein PYCCODRAFT_1422205 [Trametes coccinea BRFM310]|uniref:Uncharacterized protein n=1 Tax=Trametes coccinea (strain BRFM310) TaxID=1353009 RepID=A0A1Y2J286_TRAC3|nr:hypothetical protein PYCCODRAFT_1422205 [Trametes coccinea BRFM310]